MVTHETISRNIAPKDVMEGVTIYSNTFKTTVTYIKMLQHYYYMTTVISKADCLK